MEREFLPEKRFMVRALELAREAALAGEAPVGAVVVRGGEILGEGRNRREALQSPLAHGEMEAMERAAGKLGSWRLTGCQLYVTLEPCPMCAGAAVNARIGRIVFGTEDLAAGCCGTAANVLTLPGAFHPKVYRGFLEEECRALLEGFFRDLRGN